VRYGDEVFAAILHSVARLCLEHAGPSAHQASFRTRAAAWHNNLRTSHYIAMYTHQEMNHSHLSSFKTERHAVDAHSGGYRTLYNLWLTAKRARTPQVTTVGRQGVTLLRTPRRTDNRQSQKMSVNETLSSLGEHNSAMVVYHAPPTFLQFEHIRCRHNPHPVLHLHMLLTRHKRQAAADADIGLLWADVDGFCTLVAENQLPTRHDILPTCTPSSLCSCHDIE
jgi:hypothetical protein